MIDESELRARMMSTIDTACAQNRETLNSMPPWKAALLLFGVAIETLFLILNELRVANERTGRTRRT